MLLIVKDWFHEKKMNEKQKNVQCTEVFAILKETEKAYNVLVGDAVKSMTYWVPKSCTTTAEATDLHYTRTGLDYNEAWKEWNLEMGMYR